MGIYGGIQLPNINEENLDDRKERKQILNSLMMLDEKLRYMFQNIDIEDNLSKDSQKMFFQYGKDITNLIKDTKGNFSAFRQTIDSISTTVYGEDGQSGLVQTATSITSSVSDLKKDVSLISQEADKISWIVADGEDASDMTLTKDFLEYVGDHVTVKADLRLYGEMAVYKSKSDNTVGGYICYESDYDMLYGASKGLALYAPEELNKMIITDECIRMDYEVVNTEDEYIRKHGIYCEGYGPQMIWHEVDLSETSQPRTTHEFKFGSTGFRFEIGKKEEINDDDELEETQDFRVYRMTRSSFCCTDEGKADLGTSLYVWKDIYADSCSCCTSDRRKKNDIEYGLEEYEELFNLLKPARFRMKNGTSGRIHVGFISQDVEEAMGAVDMDSRGFAGFIKSPVYAGELKSGEPDTSSEVVDHNYALRYEEFIALNTHMIQKLMARVSKLESKLEALS